MGQTEFTGERVIPGQVEPDLWNEHYSRYLFASRLARFRNVLDIGCGTGYGSALLAQSATRVFALDNSRDALERCPELMNLSRVQASATAIPIRDGSIDLVVAFEVIEHLDDWPKLLSEAQRLLAPRGQFIVSTPNVKYYAEARAATGPNPFHAHEFEFAEFKAALEERFDSVSLFTQNHAAGVVFRPLEGVTFADTKLENSQADPETANFFLAVCAASPQTGSPTFVYMPSAANVLRERERHIERLNGELRQKDQWLAESQREHELLVEQHRAQKAELEKSNQWAAEAGEKWKASQERVAQIQEELAAEQRRGAEVAAEYEAKIDALEKELASHVLRLENDLTALQQAYAERSEELRSKGEELSAAVKLLDAAERTVVERTDWAKQIQGQLAVVETELARVRASRWIRLGRTFGLGPDIGS